MMQILMPARDFMAAGTERDQREQHDSPADQPGFAKLLDRIRERMDSLGVSAPADMVTAAALDIAQDVARFTLDWVEGDAGVPPNEIGA